VLHIEEKQVRNDYLLSQQTEDNQPLLVSKVSYIS